MTQKMENNLNGQYLELAKLEKDILKVIASNYPYTQQSVNEVYLKTEGSFDKTIEILEESLRLKVYPSRILDIVERFCIK